MQVDLAHIEKNLRLYKVCINCENINHVSNFRCVSCNATSFKDLTSIDIQERIEEDGYNTVVRVK